MTTKARIQISASDLTGPGFSSVSRNLQGLAGQATSLRGALGLLAPSLAGALSVAGVAAFVKSTNAGLLAIKDLSEATGASIESISGLENVARAAGGSLDDVSGVLIKFNGALKDADGKNGVSQALKAIGLDAAELRRIDPAQALQQTAMALSQFADDGNKARLVQELFGKSIKDAGPLLHELAEAGRLNGTVTKEQVEQADRFNKELAKFSGHATDAARAIAGPLVESMNDLFSAMRRVTGNKGGFLAGIHESAQRGQLESLESDLRRMTPALVDARKELSKPFEGGFLESLRKSSAQSVIDNFAKVERAAKELRAELFPSGPSAGGGRGFINPPRATPSVGDVLGTGSPSTKSPKATTPKLGDDMDAHVKSWEQLRKALESEGKATFEATRAPLEKLNIELARQQNLLDELGPTYRDTYERAVFAAQEAADAAMKVPEAIKDAIVVQLDELDKFAERAAENIQDALGDTLTQALSGNFSSIGKMWGNMLQRMMAEAAAAQIMKSLFGDGKGGTASGIGDVLSLLVGGLGMAGKADGGPVSAGRPYIVGERGPELMVPRTSGTVLPNGTAVGGGSTFVVNVQGDASENTIRLIRGALAQFEAKQMMRGAY